MTYLFPMVNESLSNQFIFNEKIDKEYLFSLYADDFLYVEEIFATALQYFDGDLESIELAFDSENLGDLRKAVHKIKPTFGFAGLVNIQEECKNFEELCHSVLTTENLAKEYREIMTILREGKAIIESEYKRLKEYNAKLS